jgi:hypothetical protein
VPTKPLPPDDVRDLLVLRWLAGPQKWDDPHGGAEALWDVRQRGLARDVMGRIELTDAGRARLVELEKSTNR